MGDRTSPAATATPREVIEWVHRMAADYDMTGQAELYAPDGVLEWPFAPAGVPRRIEGRERIREVLASLEPAVQAAGTRLTAIPTVAIHETTDPEVVIVEFEARAEVPTTGETFPLPYIQLFQIRDGQILLFRDYFGPLTAAALTAVFTAAASSARPRSA
jgi:ketosteroid isomerase-like protein